MLIYFIFLLHHFSFINIYIMIRSKFKQGIYIPINKEKYKGKKRPIYRSSYELKFMRYLDNSENIIEWASEPIAINYMNPLTGRPSRYYPDFLIIILNKEKKYETILIEIKPYRQTIPPKLHGNKKQKTILHESKTWAVNSSKWEAAKKFCNDRNITFKIMTEKELNI